GRVLEIGCGSGIGLKCLAGRASKVVGGDVDLRNLACALNLCHEHKNVSLVRMDAHHLPFSENEFDLLVMYEAIYYLRDACRFVEEASRVLKPGGVLLICSVNREWEDFHPSPYSTRYFSAKELAELLVSEFEAVQLFGAFPVRNKGLTGRFVSRVKRLAVKFDLIPGSLRARAYLKRVFMGPLQKIPETLPEQENSYLPPDPIGPIDIHKEHKILYAVATKRNHSRL
ncbi:MAG TPA: class I SAM-dependent methyltransferase, partial [Spirochaetia bacterium]|nr:class I SAM-dependent methyltransferase [Spirochaetia bacterium]